MLRQLDTHALERQAEIGKEFFVQLLDGERLNDIGERGVVCLGSEVGEPLCGGAAGFVRAENVCVATGRGFGLDQIPNGVQGRFAGGESKTEIVFVRKKDGEYTLILSLVNETGDEVTEADAIP